MIKNRCSSIGFRILSMKTLMGWELTLLQRATNQRVINRPIPNPFIFCGVGNFAFCKMLIISRLQIDWFPTSSKQEDGQTVVADGQTAFLAAVSIIS